MERKTQLKNLNVKGKMLKTKRSYKLTSEKNLMKMILSN